MKRVYATIRVVLFALLAALSGIAPAVPVVAVTAAVVLGEATSAQAQIAIVAGRSDSLGQDNDGTTAPIDTSGSTLIVVSLSWYSVFAPTATFMDSKGNTWTPLTARVAIVGDSNVTVQLYYCVNPTVGSGHTWTGGGEAFTFSIIQILTFSGTHASAPFDQQSGASHAGGASTQQPGSITPAGSDQLFVTAEASTAPGSTLPSGYTGAAFDFGPGTNVGSGIAYKIQTGGAAAENPQWSWSNNEYMAAVLATFKAAAGGGGGGGGCTGAFLLTGVGGC